MSSSHPNRTQRTGLLLGLEASIGAGLLAGYIGYRLGDMTSAFAGGLAAGVAASVIVLGYLSPHFAWMGFVAQTSATPPAGKERQPGKNLWDWLQLLIVPTLLAVGGLMFTSYQAAQTTRQANVQATQTAAQAGTQLEETVLTNYVDQMTGLLLDEYPTLLNSHSSDPIRDIARTRTLLALGRMNPGRRALVLQFLNDEHLLNIRYPSCRLNLTPPPPVLTFLSVVPRPAPALTRVVGPACLSQKLTSKVTDGLSPYVRTYGATFGAIHVPHIGLSPVLLDLVKLQGAIFAGATLQNSILCTDDFTDADLTNADLRGAVLYGDTFTGARLAGVKLDGAFADASEFPPPLLHKYGLHPVFALLRIGGKVAHNLKYLGC
jgi:hypothetical protein